MSSPKETNICYMLGETNVLEERIVTLEMKASSHSSMCLAGTPSDAALSPSTTINLKGTIYCSGMGPNLERKIIQMQTRKLPEIQTL